jgi:hypothetical protein
MPAEASFTVVLVCATDATENRPVAAITPKDTQYLVIVFSLFVRDET